MLKEIQEEELSVASAGSALPCHKINSTAFANCQQLQLPRINGNLAAEHRKRAMKRKPFALYRIIKAARNLLDALARLFYRPLIKFNS